MKKSLLIRFITTIAIFIGLTACHSNSKKLITGSWHVVDVKFQSASHIDPNLLNASVNQMKTWMYTFKADSTMSVKEGEQDIPNKWRLNKKGDTLIIGFGTGYFDVPSQIVKLNHEEMVLKTTLGSDTTEVTQTLYLQKSK